MQLKNHLKLVLLGLVLCFGLLRGTASAAGSVAISVEPSPTSAITGQTVTLNFYATPSGASVNYVEFNVALSNLSYQSFSGTDSAFNGSAAVVGSPTATNFTIFAGYQNFGGSSTKALVLRVTVKASDSVSTGQITISGATAGSVIPGDSNSEESMSASSQNGSVSIIAPSNGGGSGGDDDGGSSGSSDDSGSGGAGTNIVRVPGEEAGPEVPGATMGEAEFIALEASTSVPDEAAVITTKKASLGKFASIGAGLVGALIVIAGVMLFMKRRANSLVTGGLMGGSMDTPTTSTPDPTTPQPTQTPEAPKPPEDNNDGPTIIHPQQ